MPVHKDLRKINDRIIKGFKEDVYKNFRKMNGSNILLLFFLLLLLLLLFKKKDLWRKTIRKETKEETECFQGTLEEKEYDEDHRAEDVCKRV